jgi:hypothetical protein
MPHANRIQGTTGLIYFAPALNKVMDSLQRAKLSPALTDDGDSSRVCRAPRTRLNAFFLLREWR